MGARKKNVPSFDAFDLSTGENNLCGLGATKARHFTLYSPRHATGDNRARLDPDLRGKLDLMNPMHFTEQRNPGRARHWWIRVGTKDTDTSLTAVGNLAAGLENLGDNVNTARMPSSHRVADRGRVGKVDQRRLRQGDIRVLATCSNRRGVRAGLPCWCSQLAAASRRSST
ncbi:hypothetical protein [Saccharothrix deserti]|uniref:hypothetical protein n=1 Tax=Saccharothrix deserti TaxID=2593674 RepID=UPI001EE474A3|nr:hypothetical protein [Saccharothrix deserti]